MKEYDADNVQPVDGYVRNLLSWAKEEFGVKVDLDNPTRGQRLKTALALDEAGHDFLAMEVMVGNRVDSSSEQGSMFAFLKMTEAMNSNPNKKRFYEGFAHTYHGEPKETKEE